MGTVNTNPKSSMQSKVMYDTGSSWLALTSSKCSKCDTQTYDFVKTESETPIEYKLEREYYGTSEIVAQRTIDNVCLADIKFDKNKNTCIDGFHFLAITWQSGFKYQGVLGISPTNITGEGPSFLLTLAEQKKIDDPIVSFSISQDAKNDSFVIFGGIDKTQYTGMFYSYSLATDYFWAPKVDLIAYGGEIIEKWE